MAEQPTLELQQQQVDKLTAIVQQLQISNSAEGSTKDQFMKANEDISYRDLGEIDHLVFLNSYNKTPPPSDIKADRIRFYYKIGARQVFMVMTLQNCVSQAGPLSVFQVEAWLQGIVLDPSQFLNNETKI